MSKAIITLTRGGFDLGKRLQQMLNDSTLYVNGKFDVKGPGIQKIEKNITAFVGEIFNQYECLIFIMATGIVVRAIAPYIQDKKIDPAVIVLDEKGKNVISLLSGHLGGANEYAFAISELLGANPVITTASDVNQSIAVDTLAMTLHCAIEDYSDATRVTAHIVNGELVGIRSDIPIFFHLPENIDILDENEFENEKYKGMIYITERQVKKDPDKDQVILRPKNIVLGIGCRKGKSKDEILKAIHATLKNLNIDPIAIKHMATIDVKQDEPGMIDAAKTLNVPLVIISSENISAVEKEFDRSEFVKKAIGVGAVCEPAAMLSCKNGTWLQRKTAYDGITIALMREGEFEYGNHCSRNKL
ncbi:cobalt-precorrin 5A hydrolase [Anaerosolibacter carboniphilus]|uniref:Cobalt-precorrin 5A hydrolase n=1 Tax=Anaerosolibacter carboniphilus TaxID=1417629 RepID=A0A841KWP3_9FIRM|nr:cobalt-precorrin 5A hydrolase [Anaerosolibacter carboniphilus]MBB6214595.1 cobalt-precorrin 5A hydrolase [Anaerosolibacter carboniphilus]